MKSVSKFGHCKTINQKRKKAILIDELICNKKKIFNNFSEKKLRGISNEYIERFKLGKLG